MGEDPVAIREAIEETRSRMGDTVAAIGYKTDVKSRARENAVELTSRAQTSITTLGQKLRTRLGEPRVMAGMAAAIGLGVAGAAGAALAGRSLAERRRDRLAKPARKLPVTIRHMALPAARRADRWLDDTTSTLQHTFQERRDGVVHAISEEIARALAAEQQRRNPFWRKAARDAASAAATTTATLTVRRALNRSA
jgi:hypothetical protein